MISARLSTTPLWLAACAAIAITSGWLVSQVTVSDPGIAALIAATAAACLALAVYGFATTRDPLSPLPVLSLILFVLYVARPAYILASGRIGPTRRLDDELLSGPLYAAMQGACGLALLALGCLALGHASYHFVDPVGRGAFRATTARISALDRRRVAGGAALVVLAVTAALELWGYGTLIAEAGGVAAYVESLSARSSVFFGRGYLAQVGLPLKAVALALLAAFLLRPPRGLAWGAVLGGAFVLVMVGDFLTGGRAALLIGTLVPMVLLFHYLRAPLRLRTLAWVVAAALVFFVGARVATRDSTYEEAVGGSVVSQTVAQLKTLPETTLGGRDATPFDSLAMVVRARATGLEWQYGSTYLPILTFPVPRFVWADKPAGGGNTWFTRELYPAYYYQSDGAGTEASLSMLGESYANFGPGGVAIAFFVLGFFLAAVYRRMVAAASAWPVLWWAVTLPYVITLIRGDAFHSVTYWALSSALVWLAYTTLVRRA
ncbi:oligosaccharide repeat unit polymerase [Solirubrobacter phytolaccae]|uniref:Oligosaccharide repeat unit polymerase n=1 Tax=Solirubrobacter phytolaccae TaxID=1404360 RepID=A0A9X3NCJ4_9ACTN|nr:O-antigen polymerase [Solirubrobacter phytolaccae]MDA0182370.1 oligosaccharide repeat unit polymerase [Solirubrobacter phytolaccae]